MQIIGNNYSDELDRDEIGRLSPFIGTEVTIKGPHVDSKPTKPSSYFLKYFGLGWTQTEI